MRDLIGGAEYVVVADAEERAERWRLDELERCGEDDDAGAFAADESLRYVEAVLFEEIVEVEAGDSARDLGEALADLIGVRVADGFQACVELADASAGCDFFG